MYTDEQIKALAKEIGDRNYFPISDSTTRRGISIRQELMRTAMGSVDISQNIRDESIAKWASEIANALLIQMAKDELGVSNE